MQKNNEIIGGLPDGGLPDETTNDSLRTESLSLVSYTILPKVLGHPLLMKGLIILVISMSTNLNV